MAPRPRWSICWAPRLRAWAAVLFRPEPAMASDTLTIQESDELEAARRSRSLSAGSTVIKLLMPLASLRLTVVLFGMAIFLIFAGTLAQVDKDILDVLGEYFRTYFTWLKF